MFGRLDGFGNDEGFSALRQRFESAAKSWASVYEAQSLHKQLIKLYQHRQIRMSKEHLPRLTTSAIPGVARFSGANLIINALKQDDR